MPKQPSENTSISKAEEVNDERAAQDAEIARLRAENMALRANGNGNGHCTAKVTEKGGISVYGLGRYPVTLYKEQWLRLIAFVDTLKAFIVAHEAELSTKPPKA